MTSERRGKVAIAGYCETPVSRARKDKGEKVMSMEEYHAMAAEEALKSAGLTKKDIDGQGVGIAGVAFPHAEIWSAEVIHNLGFNPKLLIGSEKGGMNGTSLLIQAALAIEAGYVDTVLCLGADTPLLIPPGSQIPTWRYEQDFEKPFGMMGPNSMFALIHNRHMHQYGTRPEHTGKIAVTQRLHASLNPNAYLKAPLSMEDYLKSRFIADPIRLLDCCIHVNGGSAYVLTSANKAARLTDKPVYVLGYAECDNYYHGDHNRPEVTYSSVTVTAREAMKMAGIQIRDVSFAQLYDDYTIAVLMQIEDAGFCPKGQGGPFVEKTDISYKGELPINTGGGQLSAGQAGMAGGFHHVAEAVKQLRGEAPGRQVKDAKIGLVTGLGGLAYAVNLINGCTIILGREV